MNLGDSNKRMNMLPVFFLSLQESFLGCQQSINPSVLFLALNG